MPKYTLAALILASASAAVQAQACVVEVAGGRTVDAADYRLAYRTQPQKIVIGRPFGMEVTVCAKAGGVIDGIQIDGFMPDHRHGMNYRPTTKSLGGGRFQVDGLMFHMPGRWDIHFDIKSGGGSVRLTDENVLK